VGQEVRALAGLLQARRQAHETDGGTGSCALPVPFIHATDFVVLKGRLEQVLASQRWNPRLGVGLRR